MLTEKEIFMFTYNGTVLNKEAETSTLFRIEWNTRPHLNLDKAY